jgi:hypothetical protein
MSELPEGPSSGKAWLGFLLVYAVVCFFYPPMLGVALGIVQVVVPVFILYKVFGGKGGFFR